MGMMAERATAVTRILNCTDDLGLMSDYLHKKKDAADLVVSMNTAWMTMEDQITWQVQEAIGDTLLQSRVYDTATDLVIRLDVREFDQVTFRSLNRSLESRIGYPIRMLVVCDLVDHEV